LQALSYCTQREIAARATPKRALSGGSRMAKNPPGRCMFPGCTTDSIPPGPGGLLRSFCRAGFFAGVSGHGEAGSWHGYEVTYDTPPLGAGVTYVTRLRVPYVTVTVTVTYGVRVWAPAFCGSPLRSYRHVV
jgi:hypothetical protein